MNEVTTLVPIAFFAFLACVLLIPAWLRHRMRMAALRTISEAIGQGRAAEAELIEKLLVPARPAVGRWFTLISWFLGVASLCVGAALALSAALLIPSEIAASGMMVGSLVNACNGVALITLGTVGFWRFSGFKRPAPRWDYAAVLALICLFLGAASLGVGAGLGLSGHFYVRPAQGSAAAAGLFIGALINGCSGRISATRRRPHWSFSPHGLAIAARSKNWYVAEKAGCAPCCDACAAIPTRPMIWRRRRSCVPGVTSRSSAMRRPSAAGCGDWRCIGSSMRAAPISP